MVQWCKCQADQCVRSVVIIEPRGLLSIEIGKKDLFYLMTHSTHFIYSYMASDICKGRKELCYLMMHSTHFIYGYMSSDIWQMKKGNVLINDTLNTFYLQLYGVKHMVKEGNILFNDIVFTVIWHWTYGKGPLTQ